MLKKYKINMTQIKKEETKISVITNNGVKQKKIRINLKTANKIIFSLALVIGIFYVAGVNDLTAKGFKLRDMKIKTREMNNDNQSLEAKITDLSSYNGLEERVKILGMVSVDSINYIEANEGVVAMK